MIAFDRFSHLTFDCYGTLIDWESGILAALRPVFANRNLQVEAERILRLYAKYEATEEAGPYKPYQEVLRGVMAGLAAEFGFDPTVQELEALPNSVRRWPPFPDSVAALNTLQQHNYRLVILSNIDDALFAESNRLLQVQFDAVITAEQVRSYKPSAQNFKYALTRLGASQGQVLHVAQSIYHDHVPAKGLGFTTVWVNRKSLVPGVGVALPANATPDLEVPDMKSLVEAMGAVGFGAGKINQGLDISKKGK